MTNALHARGPVPERPRAASTGPVLVGCSHGTDDLAGRAAVRSILTGVAAARPDLDVREAFVDVQQPEVADVVAHALDGDASAAVVVPLLLSVGFHVKVDIAARGRPARRRRRRRRSARTRAWSTSSWTGSRPPGSRADDAVVLAAAGSTDPAAALAVESVAAGLADRAARSP